MCASILMIRTLEIKYTDEKAINADAILTFSPCDLVNGISTDWTNDRKLFANNSSKFAKWVDMGWA